MLKIIKKIFIILVVVIFFVWILSRGHIYKKEELSYGITFSQKQAEDLNLDWQKLFLVILEDLNVKKIRIPAYWDEIQPTEGVFDYTDLDWQIQTAGQHNAKIILTIGGRVPRWPECHFPEWTNNLTETERQAKTLVYLKQTIERYKDQSQITAWQIENEPFLNQFGECPKLDPKFLDQEIALAKSLDSRPVVITDSGELSLWIPAVKRADIFGTTMYRDTYSRVLKSYIHYPIAPGFFRLKRNIASLFAQPKDWIVIELQAEPWGPVPYQELSAKDRARTMDLQKFKDMIKFSSQTGFQEFYLWGVEYWYWEKMLNNNPGMWEEARGLF